MTVELKKGYYIDSYYDKNTKSYITTIKDNESNQIGEASYSDNMTDRNSDVQYLKELFYDENRWEKFKSDSYDSTDSNSNNREFLNNNTENKDFEESLDSRIKDTKRKTKKAKLPALSTLSPIMPDGAAGIATFNSGVGLSEDYIGRDELIKRLKAMGYKYNYPKYTDQELYEIYIKNLKAEETKQAFKKLKAAEKARKQRYKDKLSQVKYDEDSDTYSDGSYYKDGIEFESEDAAREYFGESVEQITLDIDTLKNSLEVILPKICTYRDMRITPLNNSVELVVYCREAEYEGSDAYALSVWARRLSQKLKGWTVKKEGFITSNMNGAGFMFILKPTVVKHRFGESINNYYWDVDEIERIVKQAWRDAGFSLNSNEIDISRHDNWCIVEIKYIDKWLFKQINKAMLKKELKKSLDLYDVKQSSWTETGWGNSDYGKTLRYDLYSYPPEENENINESMKNKIYLNDMLASYDIEDIEIKQLLNESNKGVKHDFKTITEGLKYFERKEFDKTGKDVELESLYEGIKNNLDQEDIKKLGNFLKKADSADDVATYIRGLLSEDLVNESCDGWIAIYNGKKLEIPKIDAKDLYDAKQKAIRELKVPKSKVGLLVIKPGYNESLTEDLDPDDVYDIETAIRQFEDYCFDNDYKMEITTTGEVDGYYLISGYIEEQVGSDKNPSEILDVLINDLNTFNIEVDVESDWQINRLYRRMVFQISTKEKILQTKKRDTRTEEEFFKLAGDLAHEIQQVGFELDNDVKYPISPNLMGGVHLQIKNPNLSFPIEEAEGDEKLAFKLMVDDLKDICYIFDKFEENNDVAMTFSFGPNKDMVITGGVDIR